MSKNLRALFALAVLVAPVAFAGCGEEEKKPAAGAPAAAKPAEPGTAKPAEAPKK